MKKTRIFWILFVIPVLFAILAGTAAAQDVDVDAMSNEELMVLLQSIMLKLEQDMIAEGKDPGVVVTSAQPSVSAGTAAQETEEETQKNSVYENKKLVLERLPDYMFVRKPTATGGGGGDDSSNSGGTRTLEFHYGDYTFTIDIPDGSYGDYGIPTDVWTAW
ncbi:MAG: hypothetical protein J5898_10955 [Lachnospiraceae bacterium]|nr:hypothetical protein [Lachnospiraceae bacterium]